jgi:hypothetical protein
MSADRYMKIVLTVIALELGWIAIKDAGVQVAAQQTEPMAVIIKGIEMPPNTPGAPRSFPVMLVGTARPVSVTSDRPLLIDAPQPLRIEQVRPIVVETGDKALVVRSVQASAATRPGE